MSRGKHPCEGCRYFHGDYLYNRCCNYIFVTGHRRPCKAGENCSVRASLQDGEQPLFGAKAPFIKGSEGKV